MKFKYQDQKLKFTIKIVNQENEEWFFNEKGKTNREEQITVLEQLIKQMKGEFWKRLVEKEWKDLEDFEKEDYSRENMKHIDDSIMVSLFDVRDALNTESLGLTYEQKRDLFHVLNEWKENEMECE